MAHLPHQVILTLYLRSEAVPGEQFEHLARLCPDRTPSSKRPDILLWSCGWNRAIDRSLTTGVPVRDQNRCSRSGEGSARPIASALRPRRPFLGRRDARLTVAFDAFLASGSYEPVRQLANSGDDGRFWKPHIAGVAVRGRTTACQELPPPTAGSRSHATGRRSPFSGSPPYWPRTAQF